jgi:ferric-dicitrate binding protein FerR (iron transport regulator)
MDNSAQLDDMLTRSLSQELSGEEQALLEEWLNAGEQNRQYYALLQDTWHIAGIRPGFDRNVEQEWAQFTDQVKDHKPGRVYRLLKIGAVAAAVLLVTGLGWNYWGNKKAAVVAVTGPEAQSRFVARHEVNTTAKPQKLLLPDGSEIWLEPKTELSWQEPFNTGRNFILKGQARFRVTTDKARPFTVYSGALSIRVLGTVFCVRAFPGEEKITVRLYEGKVVVKAADSIKQVLKKDFYLLPGQELVYDNNRYTVRVRRFTGDGEANSDQVKEHYMHNDSPSIPAGEKGSWYMFNNQSLAQVFNQLQVLYSVDIKYEPKEVRKMYFIGKFNKTDSVETILKQIAALNNLTVTMQNNTFIISR